VSMVLAQGLGLSLHLWVYRRMVLIVLCFRVSVKTVSIQVCQWALVQYTATSLHVRYRGTNYPVPLSPYPSSSDTSARFRSRRAHPPRLWSWCLFLFLPNCMSIICDIQHSCRRPTLSSPTPPFLDTSPRYHVHTVFLRVNRPSRWSLVCCGS